MPGYLTNIDRPTLNNVQFRRVPFVTHDSQTWRWRLAATSPSLLTTGASRCNNQ
jgi:hypothetical protein